jgi:SAM-dependent methyltransferase
VYDERYDNDVPSPAFEDYYRSIARALAARHGLVRPRVLDIGCGKGRFLEIFAETVSGTTGAGVDPSCRSRAATQEFPVELISDVFRTEHVRMRPDLAVCRHTLEHVPDPMGFLASIHLGLASAPGVPLMVEVPDLRWILERRAFWDFCYEHCNYFTPDSLAFALGRAGFRVEEVEPAFGGQYLWAHVRRADGPPSVTPSGAGLPGELDRYAAGESSWIAALRERVRKAAERGPVGVWGMATKGVMFCALVDPEGGVIQAGIDINVKKQGSFAPMTGQEILSPASFKARLSGPPTILVMNPNYAAEIERQAAELGLEADWIGV